MSDKDALYAALAASPITDPSNPPRRVLSQGTLNERLRHILTPFQDCQLKKAIDKGTRLHEMMHLDDRAAGALLQPPRDSASSPFQDPSELEKWGYRREGRGAVVNLVGETHIYPGEQVFEELSFDASWAEDGGANYCVRHRHDVMNCMVNGRRVKPTLADFAQVVNPVDGVLTAIDNTTPQKALGKHEREEDEVPDVCHWSDVAYLQWKMVASEDVQLRFVLQHGVTNDITMDLVRWISLAEDRDPDLVRWPGYSFNANSEEGRALLGTPNGACVGWLLVQHKHQLGHKVVEKVTLFEFKGYPMMLFHIVNAPPI